MRCSYASNDCCARAWQTLALELPFLARIWWKVKIHSGIYVPAHSTHRKESTLTNTHRSQNVLHIHLEKCKKKSFNIHSHVRPKCPTKTKMSDQVVGLRECWLSNLSDICRTFWEEYVGPESMIVDTHLECTVIFIVSDIYAHFLIPKITLNSPGHCSHPTTAIWTTYAIGNSDHIYVTRNDR